VGDSQIFDNGTNVGIGTATPAHPLDVNGFGRFYASQVDIILNATSTSQYSRVVLQENGTDKAGMEYINSAFATTARRNKLELFNQGSIHFITSGSFSTPDFSIDASGNINAVGSITGSIAALGTAATLFVVSSSGTLRSRTASEVRSDIGAQASGNYVTLDTVQTITESKTFSKVVAGGSGDYTNMTSFPIRITGTSGGSDDYWRIPFLSNSSTIAGVFNFETGKNVFWGEPDDTGVYFFRGRTINVQALSGTTATFSSSVTAASTLYLGDDGTYGSTYKTLGLTGTTNGTHRIFAGTADNLYIAAATGKDIVFWTDGSSATKASISTTGAATFSSSVTANGQITMAYGGNPRLLLHDTDSGAGNVGILFKEHTSEKWTLASVGGNFQFFNEATASNAMYITSGNNVGIGTLSPGQLLTVYQDTNGDARISLNNPNTGASARTFLYAITTGNRYVGMLAYGANATGTTYGLSNASLGILEAGGDISNLLISSPTTIVFGANNSERMRITSGGNVSIGNTNDTFKLDVSGTGRFSGLLTMSNSGNVVTDKEIIWGTPSSGDYIGQYYGSDGKFHFYNGTGGADFLNITRSTGAATFSSSTAGYGITLNHTSENLRLKMGAIAGGIINIQGEVISSGGVYPIVLNYLGGNVGIGINPQAYLDISGVADQSNFTSVLIRAGNSDGATPLSSQILFGYSNSPNYAHAIKTRHQSGSAAGNSIEFWVWKFGDAISTPAGQRVMVVEGNAVRIANGSGTINSLSASERLNVNGTVYATGYFETSDIRLKNILSTTDGDIPAITYTWKDGQDDKIHWGYAAQDVMKYLPDAVSGSEYYGLDYNQVHTYKIAQLEARIKELEQQLKNK
jgi:hypothetical protein